MLPDIVPGYLLEEQWGDANNTVNDPKLLTMSSEERFRVLAWSAACPQPERWYSYYQWLEQSGHPGAVQWLIDRYATTNRLSQKTWELTKELNGDLYSQFMFCYRRDSEHPVGIYEKERTPKMHGSYMSRMSTLPAYAVSRLWSLRHESEAVGSHLTNVDVERIGFKDGAEEKAVAIAKTPTELLAILANYTLAAQVPARAIIEHVLEVVKWSEENDTHLRVEVIEELKKHAPQVLYSRS